MLKATVLGLIVLGLIEPSCCRRGSMMVSTGTMSMSPASNRAGNDEEADLAFLGESLDDSLELGLAPKNLPGRKGHGPDKVEVVSSEKPLLTTAECQELPGPFAENGHTRRRRRYLNKGGPRMSSFMPCKEKVFEHKIMINNNKTFAQYLCKTCYSECGHYLLSTHAQGGFCNSFDFEEDFSRCQPSCYSPDWEPTPIGIDPTRRRRGVPGYPVAADPASPNVLCTKKCIIHTRGKLKCTRAGGCGNGANLMWKSGSNLNCGDKVGDNFIDDPNRAAPCGKNDKTLSKKNVGIFCDGYKQTTCTSNPDYNATCAEAKSDASCACKTPNECIRSKCQIHKQVQPSHIKCTQLLRLTLYCCQVTTSRICISNRYSEYQVDEEDNVGYKHRFDDQATKRVFKGGGAGRESPLQASLCSTDPDDCKSDYCGAVTASF